MSDNIEDFIKITIGDLIHLDDDPDMGINISSEKCGSISILLDNIGDIGSMKWGDLDRDTTIILRDFLNACLKESENEKE